MPGFNKFFAIISCFRVSGIRDKGIISTSYKCIL